MGHPCYLIGKWFLRLYGPDGVLKDSREDFNIVTTNGKEAIASLLYSGTVSSATNSFQYIAAGTGTQTATVSDAGLASEVYRVSGVASYVSGAIFQVTATFLTGFAVGALSEFGLFNSTTAGTLLSHDVLTTINKGSTDTLTIIYQLTIN